eukprot:4342870-Pyramimonas_sp.AAC.1
MGPRSPKPKRLEERAGSQTSTPPAWATMPTESGQVPKPIRILLAIAPGLYVEMRVRRRCGREGGGPGMGPTP